MDMISGAIKIEVSRQVKFGKIRINSAKELCDATDGFVLSISPLFQKLNFCYESLMTSNNHPLFLQRLNFTNQSDRTYWMMWQELISVFTQMEKRILQRTVVALKEILNLSRCFVPLILITFQGTCRKMKLTIGRDGQPACNVFMKHVPIWRFTLFTIQ